MRIPPKLKDAVDEDGRPRCTAHNRQGKRCGNPPVAGTNVCRMHGGGAPQVKKAAQIRLAMLVDPAIATLAKEMVKAERSSDRQRAANSILDRAGVPRVVRTPDAEVARALLMERLDEIRKNRTDVMPDADTSTDTNTGEENA